MALQKPSDHSPSPSDSSPTDESGRRGPVSENQPVVQELIALLQSRPALAEALKASLHKAARPGIATLAQFYDFLNEMVTLIPTDRNLNAFVLQFYYLVDLSPNDLLQNDPSFQRWTCKFAEDWGAFLDTTESAAAIKGFFADPSYHMEDYFEGPSGWLTFN
jgi:hypothetical protein